MHIERRFIMQKKLMLKKGPIKGILRVEKKLLEQKSIVVKNYDDYDSSIWWSDECGVTE